MIACVCAGDVEDFAFDGGDGREVAGSWLDAESVVEPNSLNFSLWSGCVESAGLEFWLPFFVPLHAVVGVKHWSNPRSLMRDQWELWVISSPISMRLMV